ncbi:ATP-binding protein [Vibrio ishigakensis]|nr:ATP-binding protein [Vibrio ishigakensis]
METALSDILDNSISAEASLIHVDFEYLNGKAWVQIFDNGTGMTYQELLEAMKLGSKNPLNTRSKDDLGRFGLGLKTASFSQARQLTVITKKDNTLSAMQWDLDEIATSHNGWQLNILGTDDFQENEQLIQAVKLLNNEDSGTVVLWKKLDRIDNFDSEEIKETKFNELMSNAREHISLTFHRFLDAKEGKNKPIVILFNNDKLEAYDPFCRDEVATVELTEKTININNSKVKVQPYVLPHHSKVSSEKYELYGGKEGYFQNQGFYVYRNKRLIIKANWFRVIPKSELNKLIRIRVDITNELDSIWKIDVKKANAAPPISVRNELRNIISNIEYSGRKVIKQKGYKQVRNVTYPIWERIQKSNSYEYLINKEHPLIQDISDSLDSETQRKLYNLIDSISTGFPAEHFYSEYASKTEKFDKQELDDKQVYESIGYLRNIYAQLDHDSFRAMIIGMEPFHSNQSQAIKQIDKLFS